MAPARTPDTETAPIGTLVAQNWASWSSSRQESRCANWHNLWPSAKPRNLKGNAAGAANLFRQAADRYKDAVAEFRLGSL